MGAIISKLCYSCCGRTKTKLNSQAKSKLSRNPSLIIERTQIIREDDERTEYSRVLERDFEIKGRRVVVGKSGLSEAASTKDKRNEYNDAIKVYQVEHRESGQIFALTRIKKSSLSKEEAEALCREVRLLAGQLPNHPMLVNLYWTWQDEKYLYRVDDDVSSTDKCDDLERMASQLALVIHYIHSYGLIHGNINPQSIHFTADSLKLGSFKYLRKVQGGRRLQGPCGDLEAFRAPQSEDGYFEEIDWYAYGKTLEYYAGLQGSNNALLADLIEKLTKAGAKEDRLGYGPAGFKSIQSHPFFTPKTDWPGLLTHKTDPADITKYNSLSASIGSLKSRSDDLGGWDEFVEFSWEEGGEIGVMLESIIKQVI